MRNCNRCQLLAVRIGIYGPLTQRPACLQSHFLAVKTGQPHGLLGKDRQNSGEWMEWLKFGVPKVPKEPKVPKV